ncbi:MAG: D-alanine--D-alanine ligase family protein [Patescibacteria group bacterium]|jgi:D-alanine-D-alanine ligase
MSKISKKNKIKVGVIFGGRSGEHEVSIVSAQSVMKALDRNKYEVIPIGVTKEGKWIAGPQAVQFLKEGLKKLPFKSVLTPDPTEKHLVKVKEKGLVPLKSQGSSITNLDVVFPLIHGTYGEDGKLQGLLELANIAYIGAGVLGSALGMDKIVQKQLFAEVGLAITKYTWFLSQDWPRKRKNILSQLEKELKYPMFTKPANTGSSVGVGKCHNQKELILGIGDASQYDRKVIVEQGINNISEIEVAVLGNDNPKASVPGEIIASNEFYDYDAKYVDGKSQAIIPAKLPQAVVKKIQRMAVEAFKVLDLSGMARVDFLVTKGRYQIYLNEVNTIPGFTSISMYPKLWQASGLSYSDLLGELIKLAIERFKEKNKLKTSYQPKQDWYK